MTLQSMRLERSKLLAKMEKLTDSDQWDESSRREFDRYDRQMRDLDAQIRAAESVETRKRDLNAPAGDAPPLWLDGEPKRATAANENPRSCRALFGKPKHDGGFRDWTDFVSAMEAKGVDPRIEELRAMVSNVGSSGGFAVPDAFAQEIIDSGLEDEIVRPLAQLWPIRNAGSIKIPAWDGEDHSSSLYGGFTAAWSAENSTISETDSQLRQVLLDPKKIVISTSVTRELEQDSIGSFASYLKRALSRALSFNMDDKFINGSGSGEPLGILAADCTIEVSKETGQAAASLVLENLAAMYSRMLPASVRRAVWVVHPSVIPDLLTLSLSVGTGGTAYPVLQQNGGLSIFNRPVVTSEKCQQIGTTGDIYFADFGWYAIGLSQDLRIDKSMHVHWTTDKTAYRIVARVDGQPLLDAAVTPLNGTDTLSPFVRLQSRS